jgi:hypothetical protein
MLEGVTSYARAHPYQTGALVLMGATAIYLIMSSGSGGGTTVAPSAQSESLQMAALEMGNRVQLAQIQAGSAASVIHGQVEIAGLKAQSETFLGELALNAQVAIQQMLANVNLRNIAGQEAVSLAQINASSYALTQQYSNSTEQARIAASAAESTARINAETTSHIVDQLTQPRTTTTTRNLSLAESITKYLGANPDVAAFFYNHPESSNADFANPNIDTLSEYALYHYTHFGIAEGRRWETTETVTTTT